MDWSKLYKAPQKANWKGRSDGEGAERFHEIVELVDLRNGIPSLKNSKTFALIGFASDLGIERNKGRLGASEGPLALRKALATMPSQDPSKITLYDVGDIVCERDLEFAQSSLAILIAMLLAQNVSPVVLGGGHEVAWAAYQGLVTYDPKLPLPIFNFDAHYDLRPLEGELGTSGTSFRQIQKLNLDRKVPFDYTVIGLQPQSNTRRLHDYAKELNVKVFTAEELNKANTIKSNSPLYLSVCMDVFGSAYAPGVSAPQPLGISPTQILPIFRKLAPHALSFDIAELSPSHDIDHRTAALGASLISIYLDSKVNSL